MYKLFFAEIVKKQCKQIPKKDLGKIQSLILNLEDNPRPLQCKKLVGGLSDYRVRYRDWRILYTVDDLKKQVVVYGVLNRKEAYR